MRSPCRALLWSRLDTVGTDFALVDDAERSINARGVATAEVPVPHACWYDLTTDAEAATRRLQVVAEGAGWRRELSLERSAAGWRMSTSARGDLDAEPPGLGDPGQLRDAFDVDLEATVLTNTLPIRRLRLLGARPGTAHPLLVAWVRVPSLAVRPVRQTYTVITEGMVRHTADMFTVDLSIDAAGFVTEYPGYAMLSPTPRRYGAVSGWPGSGGHEHTRTPAPRPGGHGLARRSGEHGEGPAPLFG